MFFPLQDSGPAKSDSKDEYDIKMFEDEDIPKDPKGFSSIIRLETGGTDFNLVIYTAVRNSELQPGTVNYFLCHDKLFPFFPGVVMVKNDSDDEDK